MKRIFLLLFALSSVFASEKTLSSFLTQSKSGDYIVAQNGKLFTLIHVRAINEKTLILEEISGSSTHVNGNWKQWVKNKAPGATSWSMIEIDVATGQVLECFSFSRNTHIQMTKKESFLANLLTLPLHSVSLENRRRIGPPPMSDEPDFRKIWNPELTFEGNEVKETKWEVLTTTWPKDGSDLDGKDVTLYFELSGLTFFPCWVDIETSHITGRFHIVDSGKNLVSPYRSFPRRAPQFIGEPKKTESGLTLTLKSPRYFHEFNLFAIDITEEEKELFSMPCRVQFLENETLHVHIDQKDLKSLTPKHQYHWVLLPLEFDDSYSATSKPYQAN